MSQNDEQLNRGLQALAASGPCEAPAGVEAALLSVFRKRKSRRAVGIRWVLAVAAVVAVVLVAPGPKPAPPPEPRLAHMRVPEVPLARELVRPAPARRRKRRAPVPGEIATRFYPLAVAAGLSPLEYGTLVRVELPRSALRVVGLPVNEDRLSERINADVLLGQDGLARAVRFIQ